MKTIKFNISKEKMISRIPGLFAYVDFDEFGNAKLYSATDAFDGCYGKIVENIKLPQDISLIINYQIILKAETTYSFRTLIDYYYQYKDTINTIDLNEIPTDEIDGTPLFDLSFIDFMERGIGKITVPNECKGKNHPQAPEYVYLIHIGRLYEEMLNLKRMKDNLLLDEEKRCCLEAEYENKGGDDFLGFLMVNKDVASEIAAEYYGYARNCDKKMTLDMDVLLTNTYNDLGIVSSPSDDEIVERISPNIVPSGNKSLNGKTDSKLKDMRRTATYTSETGSNEIPEDGEDWLFYYREKMLAGTPLFDTDRLGNILTIDGETATDGESENLSCYGNWMDSIVATKQTDGCYGLTFTYVIDGHLNATYGGSETDDDGNEIHYWGNFVWDTKLENGGIKYIETFYCYEGSSLYDLIANGYHIETPQNSEENVTENPSEIPTEDPTITPTTIDIQFEDYVMGCYNYTGEDVTCVIEPNTNNIIFKRGGEILTVIDSSLFLDEGEIITTDLTLDKENGILTITIMPGSKIIKFPLKYLLDITDLIPYEKFEFSTKNTVVGNSRIINNEDVDFTVNLADFEFSNKGYAASNNPYIVREEYFNGVSYAPKTDINVNIERGSTAAFEKHIRLGEIKTMEDLEESPFFKISENA